MHALSATHRSAETKEQRMAGFQADAPRAVREREDAKGGMVCDMRKGAELRPVGRGFDGPGRSSALKREGVLTSLQHLVAVGLQGLRAKRCRSTEPPRRRRSCQTIYSPHSRRPNHHPRTHRRPRPSHNHALRTPPSIRCHRIWPRRPARIAESPPRCLHPRRISASRSASTLAVAPSICLQPAE